jgi:hypothetical protein
MKMSKQSGKRYGEEFKFDAIRFVSEGRKKGKKRKQMKNST